MKKKLIVLAILLITITGCNKKNKEIKKQIKKTVNQNVKKEIKVEEKYEDKNDIKLAIYKYNSNNLLEKTNEYTSNWINGEDISYFTIFYTQDDYLTYDPFITLYNRYNSKYPNVENVKNGIMIEFNKGDEKIIKTILNPNDALEYFDYVQVYLYDDVLHQNDSWYSHIIREEFNENTHVTTFKITAGYSMDKVTSDVIVTAFCYDSEDDFKDGIYRGNSFYKVTLKRG